jgi:hypothetical protein
MITEADVRAAINDLPEKEYMDEDTLSEIIHKYFNKDDAIIVSHRRSGEGSGAFDYYYWRCYDIGKKNAKADGIPATKPNWCMFVRLLEIWAYNTLRTM